MPVHPFDRNVPGVRWAGDVYVDRALPFGLRLALKLFTAVDDALLWIMGTYGFKDGIHYLDDILILGSPGGYECGRNLRLCLGVCRLLGVTVAPHKTEGPLQRCVSLVYCWTHRGWNYAYLRHLQSLLREWRGRKICQKRQLLSLIGQLQHACEVVMVGHLTNLSTVAKQLHHHIKLNGSAHILLLWWDTFLGVWNGVLMMPSMQRGTADITLTLDASGGWGGGAFTSRGHGSRCKGPCLGPLCISWSKNWRQSS